MGLTDKGYQRLTYADILNETIQKAKELYGENIDTSDQSFLGKYIRIIAYRWALEEELSELVYYSRSPNTASGMSLDRLTVFGGITRNAATPARYSVQVKGTAGYVIEAGLLVGTETGLTFYSTQEATIGEDGTCLIMVECTESGTIGNVSAATLNTVVNPDASITSVSGIERLSAGQDEESDADLRVRLKSVFAGSGSGNENAIRAAILRVPTVEYAAVISNNSDAADSEGRPPHSFECYVLGGDAYEQEIAEAIFEKRPVGIQTVGEKAVTITDISGNERVVNYTSAPRVSVAVRASIKTNVAFPADGIEQIQAAVANFINGIGIGNPLVLSSIYGYIYGVAGVSEVAQLELSTDGGSTFSAANVTVPEYGVVACAGVTVEVVA